MIDSTPFKTCSKCGTVFPNTTEYFYKKSGRPSLFAWCKACHVVITTPHAAKWNKEHPDKVKVYNRIEQQKYQTRYPEKHAAKQQRRRSRKQALATGFSKSDWDIVLTYFNGTCAYCGSQQTFWDRLAQEHFIPLSKGGGYVPTNIIPACRECNSSKKDKPANEWLQWKFGKHKAKQILERINRYFEIVKDRGMAS